MKRVAFLTLLVAMMAVGCGRRDTVRAVYHWKTTYNPTEYEKQWMRDHKVQRLYLRLFDVDVYDCREGAAPIATTRFLQPLPDSMEIVPVVFITNEAMDNGIGLSDLIAERVMRMAECNGFEVHELQVDCDWTERTKFEYHWFCHHLQELLHEQGIQLSSTVRLHQVDTTLNKLDVDRMVLMLYNTGDLRSAKTRNSILDYRDVRPYMKRLKGDAMTEMGTAWPVFGWGAAFDRGGQFSHIVPSSALATDTTAKIREEWGEMRTMRRVKKHLPRKRGAEVVLYHLDSLNLSKYSFDDIEYLYSR